MFSHSPTGLAKRPIMKHRRRFVSVTAAAFASLALSAVAPSLSSPASAATGQAKAVSRPWFEHGSAEFDSEFYLTHVKGTDAHMGKVFDPNLGVVYAPNGDTAFYQHGDDLDATSVKCSAAVGVYLKKHADGFSFQQRFNWTITGGTGRFTGATGGGETEACIVVNPDGTGFFEYEGHGTITY